MRVGATYRLAPARLQGVLPIGCPAQNQQRQGGAVQAGLQLAVAARRVLGVGLGAEHLGHGLLHVGKGGGDGSSREVRSGRRMHGEVGVGTP
jgi:hypothetical protein